MLVTLGSTSACDDYEVNEPRLTVEAFMQQTAINDLFEISTGNIAAQHGSTAAVKAFGQQLGADHTKSLNELKTIAGQKEVALPQIMPQEKTQLVIDLPNAKGSAF